jgi:four helix bundle protein
VRSEFRDLVAYQRATALSSELHRAVAAWPKFDMWSLGLQLVRAADSIGANIAEAAGRFHVADRRRLLLIARGSLYEAEHWIATAIDRGLLAREPDGLNEVARTLGGLIAKHAPG